MAETINPEDPIPDDLCDALACIRRTILRSILSRVGSDVGWASSYGQQ